MKPYYEDGSVTIYHDDCREDRSWLEADVLVVDPPYGIDFKSGWTGSQIANDGDTDARDAALMLWGGSPALVFASPREARPKLAVATLVWHRPGSGMGDLTLPWQPDFEMIHVFGDGFSARVRGPSVLRYPWDVYRGDAQHPHRKPIGLMRDLIQKCPPGTVADPFMGTGTTLRAAKDLGRRAIGIEIEERYCEIAALRCAQEVFDFAGAG